jgi:ABC-2 type transport system permease protein
LNKIRRFFSGKTFTYYMTTSMMLVAVVGILLLLNILVQKVERRWDLTLDRRFSISNETVDYIKGLDANVSLSLFSVQLDQLPDYLKTGLEQYATLSPKLTLSYKDPDKNPGLLSRYGLMQEQGAFLVVESGERFRAVNLSEVWYEYQSGSGMLESKLTGAISYVTDTRQIKMYLLTGHGETTDKNDISEIFARMEDSAIVVDTLNLAALEKVPEDALAVGIVGPKNDISPEEKERFLAYIKEGGNLLVLLHPDLGDPLYRVSTAQMPNLMEVLAFYNVSANDDLIVERASANTLFMRPPWIFSPVLMGNQITQSIEQAKLRVSFPGVRSLEINEENRMGTTVEPFATTSADALGKTLNGNFEIVLDRMEGDAVGPLSVGMLSIVDLNQVDGGEMDSEDSPETNSAEEEKAPRESKAILMGNADGFLSNYITSTTSMGNVELFVNSVKWLADYTETISIAPKIIEEEVVSPSANQVRAVYFVIVAMPLTIGVLGFIVWKVRRRL